MDMETCFRSNVSALVATYKAREDEAKLFNFKQSTEVNFN